MIQSMIQMIQLIILGAVRFGLERCFLARSWLETVLHVWLGAGSEQRSLAWSRACFLAPSVAIWLGAVLFG